MTMPYDSIAITAKQDVGRIPWRDLTDPRRARDVDELEEGLKDPIFENLAIPECLGPVTLLVDDHKVKRYAFTVDDYHPWSFGSSPFGHRVGQAGLLTNDLLQLFTTRYAPSRVVGLHTEEQLWFDRPVQIGTHATLKGAYVKRYKRRGLGYVVMEAQAADEAGAVLLRHRGIEVLRTHPGAVVGRSGTTPAHGDRRVTGEYDPDLPYIYTAGHGVRAGMPVAPLRKVVTQEQASVFSRVGEYVVNIHNSLAAARAAGLAVPIVQGQQQVCLLLELMTRFFGQAWLTEGWIRCKFIRPVMVFEPLEVGAVVSEVEAAGTLLKVVLDVWIRGANGALCTVGWARCSADATFPTQVTPALEGDMLVKR